MAARPIWKGYLKLSLVTCAVEVSSATTHAEKVSFKIINKSTGHTVNRQYLDSETGKPVTDKNEVKGYKLGDDKYLVVEDKDFDKLQIESSHTLDLDGFIKKSSIDQIYLDTPYYVAPADKVSEEAFAVIRGALDGKKMAALARIVLFRRERPCVLEPFGNGMLLTTLRYGRWVREADDIFKDIEDTKVDKDVLSAAKRVIGRKTSKFNPNKFEDRYQTSLHKLIETKGKSKKAPVVKADEKPSNVINLFDALKKSLADDKGKGKAASSKPARPKPKAKAKSTARSRPHAKQRKSA